MQFERIHPARAMLRHTGCGLHRRPVSSTIRQQWSLSAFAIKCALLTTIFTSTTRAEDAQPVVKSPQRSEEAARSLFDGQTLTGWELVDLGPGGKAEAKEGAILLSKGNPITSLVWRGEKLPHVNYELTMQARRIEGDDFFATVTFPVKESYCSLVLGGWGGGVIGLSSLDGADASENETTDYFQFEAKRWYKIRVRVTDTRIQAWIDDKQVVNVDYSDKTISVRIEMELSKPLGLSSYQTTGEVRGIQVRSLSAAEKGQVDQ